MPDAIRAVGYVRVSKEESALEGVSLDAQRARIKAYCDFMGFALVDICADEGLSGKDTNRPGLQRALLYIEKAQATAIVVFKLDRLSRSTIDTLQLVRWLEDREASFHSITEKIDTKTPLGEFFTTILAAFAQMERANTVYRTKAALQYKQEMGEHVGQIPYGFRLEGGRLRQGKVSGGHLVPHEPEQEVIARMKAMREAGFTLQQVADRLNTLAIPTRRGGRWFPTTVKNAIERTA